MGKVIVVGSSNSDLVIGVPRIPLPGETISGTDIQILQGGKGANQAVAAARAGAETLFIAKVGDDNLGKKAINAYKKEAIDTSFITVQPNCPTGTAMIMVETRSGQNSIVISPGANAKLTPEDVIKAEAEIKKADVMLVQLEIPLETVSAALKIGKKHGLTTVMNPAPAKTLSKELVSMIDCITPNETETAFLTGIQPIGITCFREASLALNTQNSIITLGESGAYLFDSIKGGVIIPTNKVKAIDTTAAGDVFNGYLAAGISEGLEWEENIWRANMAAAISVTRKGAQPSIPFMKEVKNLSI